MLSTVRDPSENVVCVCVSIFSQTPVPSHGTSLTNRARARLPADHTRHDGGQAEGREGVDEAALAHVISHRGTTIFRA